ncbi:hypothetical protein QYE76_028489 [Lolium multiflorum]|uniref:CCHC-type domain-containing protein n=1 Tax=Lolium multiflorum TaxID=4521 RepID=A0AAD8QL37_LOLMU|nr:hypothetical protein QYE76_028489 [Lolium multiflorum]
MCLTKRYGSGDAGGDWEPARSERRRRRSARRPGGRPALRASPSRKGNRFSPLVDAVAEVEDLVEEIWCSDEEPVRPPSPAPANLGRFGPDLGGNPPLGHREGSPRVGSLSPAPPPPLESDHFPPLPALVVSPRCPSSAASLSPGPALVQIGAFVVEIPPALGRTPARGAPPPLGFSTVADPLLLDAPGPVGPAQGEAGAVTAQFPPDLGPVGVAGPARGAVGPCSADAPGSGPSDACHVADLVDDRSGASRVSLHDGFTPQPPAFKWLWLPPQTLDRSLGFPATASDVRRNLFAAKILTSRLDPASGARTPVLVPMERDRNSHGKRPFEAFNRGYPSSREQDLRQKLDREQEEQRRQQRQRDREVERASSSSWRSEGERSRQDSRAPPPPPPPPRGRDSGKNAGRRSFRQHQGPPADGPAPNLGQASGPGGAGATSLDAAHITCYNCGKQGHVQAACVDEPFCVNCKKVGHLSAMCAAVSKALAPFWAGFGGGRQGFCCLEVPEEELQKPASNSATVILEGGHLSAEQVEDEFKDLVDENWNWQVRQLGTTDFAVVFPSKESLVLLSAGAD